MESFATAYPVIFNDGEEDHDKGHIGLHSVLNFKKFQAQLSRVVGLPPNQLSTVFICTIKDTDKRQKLPIGESTNFNIILNQHHPSRERDCHFLVSIKKSKKERKGGRKKNTEVEDDDSTSSRGDVSPPEQRPKNSNNKEQQLEKVVNFPESTSPTSILQRSLSPAVSSPEDAGMNLQENMSPNSVVNNNNNSSSNNNNNNNMDTRKLSFDKILLRRDNSQPQQQQQQGGSNRGETMVPRVEGFSLPGLARPPPVNETANRWNSEASRGLAARVVINNSPSVQNMNHQGSQVRGGDVAYRQRFNDVIVRGMGTPQNAAWLNMLPSQQRNARGVHLQRQPKFKSCKFCQDPSFKGDFHYCVDDIIFEGFKGLPPAGPIQKKSPA